MKRSFRLFGFLTASVALIVVAFVQRDPLLDWLVLRGYQPSVQIVAFAERTAMTDRAKRYLYINKPMLDGRDAFNEHCKNDKEHTVILGCFFGDRQGIFIYNVTDYELDGVREVTTAHEMLHQAYDRLLSKERMRIDQLVTDFSKTITDEEILSQIETYRKSDIDALPNEMHSLFGTQVAKLPAELEAYYEQYFTDRTKVVTLYDKYQAAFTSRKKQIKEYDKQLAALKIDIDTREAQLRQLNSSLDAQRTQMDAKLRAGDTAGYNRMVASYNAQVGAYNSGYDILKAKIDSYNMIVDKRNAIADQEEALQRSMSSKSLPSSIE